MSRSKATSQDERTWKSRLWRATKVTSVTGLVLVLLAIGAFFIAYAVVDIPDPNEDFRANTSFVYFAGGQEEIGRYAVQNRVSVDLDEIPQSMQDAVISAENRSFYTDPGVSIPGIVRAAWNNFTGGSTQGASTITQQYVKILYLDQEQTYTRKFREAIIAIKIERELSKDEILEGYLNTIYFGRGAYGVQAASQAYFAINVQDLDIAQSAALAAILNNPGSLDPAGGEQAQQDLLERYQYVLDGMVETGALEAAERDRLAVELPAFAPNEGENTLGGPNGFLLTMAETELRELGFTDAEIRGGGLTIETTFDAQAQQATIDAVNSERPEGLPDLDVAVASVEPGTGALRALYGGPDYVTSQQNWALLGGAPGSSFKAFALAAALDQGVNLYSENLPGDSPLELGGDVEVENQGDTDYGSVNLLEATEDSINTAYVDLTQEIGPEAVLDAALAAGIPDNPDQTNLQPVATIALGSAQIPVVEMAEAYATFAAQGTQADWYVIQRVTDASGEVLYEAQPETERAFRSDVMADLTFALEGVVESGSGTAAQGIDRPAAGKTGTATNGDGDVVSSWFVGYTPQLATAVMYVRDVPGQGYQPLDGYLEPFFGGTYPAQTWTAMMSGALEGKDVLDFPDPEFVNGGEPEPPPPSPEPQPQTPIEPEAPPPPPQTPTQTPTPTPTPTTPSPTTPPSDPGEDPTGENGAQNCLLVLCEGDEAPRNGPPGNGQGQGPHGRRQPQ